MSKKQKVGIGIIILALAIVTVASTYAFFTANFGSTVNQTASITTGTMALVFSDNDNGVSAELNFGGSVTKYFTIENTGTLDAVAKISWDELVNTYLAESLTYKLEYSTSEAGAYTEVTSGNVPRSATASTQELANGLTIPAGTKYYYRLTITLEYLSDVDQTADLSAIFATKFTLEEGETKSQITATMLGIVPNTGTPDFSQVATTDEGVFAMEDDYGTSYYYRGAVTNNYVYFAGFYWRIIRVNGDGSVRMIYDGTQAYANGTNNTDRLALTSTAWNANYNDAKYVGWMFGGADGTASTSKEGAQTNETDSDIKEKVDAWYKTNIVDAGYADAVSDEIFCNDREIVTDLANSNGGYYSGYTTLGYGKNATLYMAASRVGYNVTNPTPSFTCTQQNDAFTVSDTTNGNGALTYPVGLITADEIVAAGSGKYNTANSSYYLYKGSFYWSLSPGHMHSDGYAFVFYVYSTGALRYGLNVSNAYGAVAPVINLSAEYAATMTGTGTATSPYTAS